MGTDASVTISYMDGQPSAFSLDGEAAYFIDTANWYKKMMKRGGVPWFISAVKWIASGENTYIRIELLDHQPHADEFDKFITQQDDYIQSISLDLNRVQPPLWKKTVNAYRISEHDGAAYTNTLRVNTLIYSDWDDKPIPAGTDIPDIVFPWLRQQGLSPTQIVASSMIQPKGATLLHLHDDVCSADDVELWLKLYEKSS